MLQLNYRDPRPIYEQVKSEFRRLILSGALARGDKLPSVRELAGLVCSRRHRFGAAKTA